MLKPDPDISNNKKNLYKNALTGKLTLESKLKELASLQNQRVGSITSEEQPVIKYFTNNGNNYPTSPLPDAYSVSQNPFAPSTPRQLIEVSSSRFYENALQSTPTRGYVPKFHKTNNFKIPSSLLKKNYSELSSSKAERYPEKLERFYNSDDFSTKDRLNISEGKKSLKPTLPCQTNFKHFANNNINSLHLHQSFNNLDIENNIFPMPTPNFQQSDSSNRLTKVGMVDKTNSNMLSGDVGLVTSKTNGCTNGYTPSTNKNIRYQQWSSTLNQSKPSSRPCSSRKRNKNTSATNTINSYLQKLADEHNKDKTTYAPTLHSDFSVLNQLETNKSNVQYSLAKVEYDRGNLSSRSEMRNGERVFPAMSDLLKDISITNNHARSKVLVSPSGTTLLPSQNKISTLSKNRLALAAHRNQAIGGNGSSKSLSNANSANHVSSIPFQNSRLISDESLTVHNSSNSNSPRTLLKSAGKTRRVRSAKQRDLSKIKNGDIKNLSKQNSGENSRVNSAKFYKESSEEMSNGTRLRNMTLPKTSAKPKTKSVTNKTVILRNTASNRQLNEDADVPPVAARYSNNNLQELSLRRRASIAGGEAIREGSARENGIPDNQLQFRKLNERKSKHFIEASYIQQKSNNQPYVVGSVETTEANMEDEVESEQDEIEIDETITDEFVEDNCETIDGGSFCQESDTEKTMDEFYFDDNDIDCVDASAIDCLDDDVASEDTNSEYSLSTSDSQTAMETNTVDTDIKPALNFGNFSNCPPVINFATKSEKVEQLPADIRKLLKWKMSPITPVVVKHTIARSGFKPSKKSYDWIGYFGKHMKSNGFRQLREYQKINHFPGSFQLGRKDRLWRNLSRMQTRFGKKEFGFIPQSFILPWDKKLLKTAWEEGNSKQKFIIKPPASARGIGIRVIHKWNQVPTKKPMLVQKYIARPYLINGRKFDLRVYVYVTSFDPLRIYMFDDGLVRFATCKYSNSMKHLANRYMHLTNYSVNKKSSEFEQNDDASACQGHKWSIKALWRYLQEKGVNTDKTWAQIKDIVIKTIISVEQFTNSLVKSNCRRPSCCHELFGFDIMLDDRMKPWIIEVNISPSLHSNSPLDAEIKGGVVKDMFNLAGFQVPDKKALTAASQPGNNTSMSAATTFSQEKRKQSHETTPDSRSKHTYFAQHHKQMDEGELMNMMLDILTVNDIQVLVENEQEFSRKGNFERIFPGGHETKKYMNYFEQPRYYNLLEHMWEIRYQNQRHKGTALLESFCRRGLHKRQTANSPPIPPEHVWSPTQQSKQFISPRNDLRAPVLSKYSAVGSPSSAMSIYSMHASSTNTSTTRKHSLDAS